MDKRDEITVSLAHTSGQPVKCVIFHSFDKPKLKYLYKYSDAEEQEIATKIIPHGAALPDDMEGNANASEPSGGANFCAFSLLFAYI